MDRANGSNVLGEGNVSRVGYQKPLIEDHNHITVKDDETFIRIEQDNPTFVGLKILLVGRLSNQKLSQVLIL